jgi:hypothetical protein
LDESALTSFQQEVARLFFSVPQSDAYLLAGGAALVASELTTRPTRDLDLFTHAPTESVTAGRDALVTAVVARGWTVTIVRDAPTFCRLVVHGPEDLLVDLAVDSPPTSAPTMTFLGPTLAPLELAGRKLLALFGRAEARDFADVFVLAQRFGTSALLDQAAQVDAGFNEHALAEMLKTLGRFVDDELPADPGTVPAVREFFASWAAELSK